MSQAYWRNQRRGQPKPRACSRCGNDLPAYFLNSHLCEWTTLDMSTGEIDTFLGRTEPPRDRYGRPMILTPDGKQKAYTRCTTFVGALEDTYGLGLWQQRMVALGLAQRDDLLLAVASHTAENRDELNKLCEAAKEAAAASSGATKGTALHKMCERLDSGEKFSVPTAAKADVAAYQRATRDIRWTHIERILVHDGLEVAGTPDRIGIPAGGGRALVWDIKTGSIEFGMGKIAMQLAMYARSQVYDVDLGTREPLDVDLNTAVIIHLPAGEGRCELVDVDIAAGWEGVQLAAQVRAWRKRKGLSRPHGEAVDLAALVAQASDEASLRALWSAHAHEWTDDLTALAKGRLAALAS